MNYPPQFWTWYVTVIIPLSIAALLYLLTKKK
jgi:hypothetical protein